MNLLDYALLAAEHGFCVFPLRPRSKLPQVKKYPELATKRSEVIQAWWAKWPNANVGISTSHFAAGALIVIDVDNKDGKRGSDTIAALRQQGFEFPSTFTQRTPTGGEHLVYSAPYAVKQGVEVLGPGLDIRSRGGFIVGAGSTVDAGEYTADFSVPAAPAPQWLLDRLERSDYEDKRTAPGVFSTDSVDQRKAKQRAVDYLCGLDTAGAGERNAAGFRAAAQLKDFGLSRQSILDIMLEWWSCQPMLDHDELRKIIGSAFDNSDLPPGSASPEIAFSQVVPHAPEAQDGKEVCETPPPSDSATGWMADYNSKFAHVIIGSRDFVLWESTDHEGNERTEFLAVETFYRRMASDIQISDGGKAQKRAQLWMSDPARRTLDGICFVPGKEVSKRFYNLWRGFSVEPASKDVTMHSSVAAFLEHAYLNVCGSNHATFAYLIGYFAHLIQRPSEKPLVALVFRGEKGSGKNALVDRVGQLLGRHYTVADDKRYLLGNFNSHLEDNLFFVLDEAAPWSGDKGAEGALKGLITAPRRRIERKGQDSYEVANYTRVAIISNEDWIVPATQDERRYAIFNVGNGRKQDRRFFHDMRVGMEQGGYAHLLRYLLDYDLSSFDVNGAPETEGLYEQKLLSLDPVHQWWFKCLDEGWISHSDFDSTWPQAALEKERVRAAYRRYHEDRRFKRAVPDDMEIGRRLMECVPQINGSGKVKDSRGVWVNSYKIPDLATCRKDWDRYIGFERKWSE